MASTSFRWEMSSVDVLAAAVRLRRDVAQQHSEAHQINLGQVEQAGHEAGRERAVELGQCSS